MYVALLICAALDLVLSYTYFLHNADIFLSTESNIEFVNFLRQGDFPFHNFFKFILALPVLLFILSWFDLLREHISGKSLFFIMRCGRCLTLAIPSLFCVSYSFSGMTWYTNSQLIYDILSVLETMIQGVIMIVFFFLFLLTFYLFCDQQKTL